MKDFKDYSDDSTLFFKNYVDELDSEEYVIHMFKDISRVFEFISNKKKKSKKEELEQYYNVYIYQVLPYPPDSKFNKKI